MKTEPIKIKIDDLKTGDIFSFRTIERPIWWRFIKFEKGELIYEEIRSKYRHKAVHTATIILKR